MENHLVARVKLCDLLESNDMEGLNIYNKKAHQRTLQNVKKGIELEQLFQKYINKKNNKQIKSYL